MLGSVESHICHKHTPLQGTFEKSGIQAARREDDVKGSGHHNFLRIDYLDTS